MVMTYRADLADDDNRGNRDRRRNGNSMINNYTEYSGPERRTGKDRRTREGKTASISATDAILQHY
jgi:hypothetical protein